MDKNYLYNKIFMIMSGIRSQLRLKIADSKNFYFAKSVIMVNAASLKIPLKNIIDLNIDEFRGGEWRE